MASWHRWWCVVEARWQGLEAAVCEAGFWQNWKTSTSCLQSGWGIIWWLPETDQSSGFLSPEKGYVGTIHQMFPIYFSQLLNRTTLGPDKGKNCNITSAAVKNLRKTNLIQNSRLVFLLPFLQSPENGAEQSLQSNCKGKTKLWGNCVVFRVLTYR